MPGKIKVQILSGRDLPVMDRANNSTDAFVEIKFGSSSFKTDVCRRTLDPQWTSEWYRFEVDDEDLQDEMLQIRVFDHDTYSAHDAIGKVYIDLNPLLMKDRAHSISGWFPIYDTMHGIRGELKVVVKLELFSDFNKFRQSSCGVKFFYTSGVPLGYAIHSIHGFVEELVVNDDPEYDWIDKIRSMRASNEARQIQFSKLSGELQRKIGLKVLEMNGNGVIGYHQCIDLEGESGVVVRGIGTSVTLHKNTLTNITPPFSISPGKEPFCMAMASDNDLSITNHNVAHTEKHRPLRHLATCPSALCDLSSSKMSRPTVLLQPPTPENATTHTSRKICTRHTSLPASMLNDYFGSSSTTLPEDGALPSSPTNMTCGGKLSCSPARGIFPVTRRSSDSDIGTPPIAGSLCGSSSSGGGCGPSMPKSALHRPLLEQDSIDMLEYPFFTIKNFPPGFVVHLGGVVSARSVKLLDKIHNPDEPETRDAWWIELRTEIRSHARAMGCHAVIGYSEETTICDEIIVLSACGTAAIVNMHLTIPAPLTLSLDRQQFEKEKDKRLHVDINLANQHILGQEVINNEMRSQCSLCHIPYKENSLPFRVNLSKCIICRKFKVPDVLFTTIECPVELPIVGKGCLIQARIFRQKKDGKGETNAKEISDSLPFMEIELHNQLINKLKVKGMNSLHGLKIQFSVGERLLVAIATATGVFSAPLAPPPLPRVLSKSHVSTTNSSFPDIQRKVLDTINRNKEIYGLQSVDLIATEALSQRAQLTDDSEEEANNDTELSNGNKDTFILEIDDAEDMQFVSVLVDPMIPEGFDLCNTETVPGVNNAITNLQMFTRVWRDEIRADKLASPKSFAIIFDIIIRSLCFKLRSMKPCALCRLNFDVDIPEEDEIQITVTGMCVGLGEPQVITNGLVSMVTTQKQLESTQKNQPEPEDMMFQMEMMEIPVTEGSVTSSLRQLSNPRGYEVMREKKMRYHSGSCPTQGIEITPLIYIPHGRIDQYLGHLNFFLIRESTSVREEGGLNGFLHSFIVEIMAICRAHVVCLGGNALVAYRMSECVLDESLHKNQSQCLINVSGDITMVTYGVDQWHPPYSAQISAGSRRGSASVLSPLSAEQ